MAQPRCHLGDRPAPKSRFWLSLRPAGGWRGAPGMHVPPSGSKTQAGLQQAAGRAGAVSHRTTGGAVSCRTTGSPLPGRGADTEAPSKACARHRLRRGCGEEGRGARFQALSHQVLHFSSKSYLGLTNQVKCWNM